MRPPLACPVRTCHLPLDRSATTWACPRGHSFDVARSGYVNLLQPQDRRSRHAGDTRGALDARGRLLAAGVGRRVLDAFVTVAAALLPTDGAAVADLGCGFGDALGALGGHRHVIGIGIDLAATAVDVAARRFPAMTWVAANADRRLPLLDASLSLVLSLHARRNPDECHRVLEPGGHLLIAVPAPDDVIELRQAVLGEPAERDRTEAVIADHQGGFELVTQSSAREHHDLAGEPLRDLLRGTYRGERASHADRLDRLGRMPVTLASDFILLRRR